MLRGMFLKQCAPNHYKIELAIEETSYKWPELTTDYY